jgi:hypothetical protein
MADDFELWKRELVAIDDGFEPTIDYPAAYPHDTSTSAAGYWRVFAARTKNDWPLIIWRTAPDQPWIMQWGGGQPKPVTQDEYNEFCTGTFFHCGAVRKAEFETAVLTKHWPDGKAALPMSEEERLDIIPSTPASEGGNMPEGDQFHEQVTDKIGQLVDKAKALGAITSLEIANKAAEILEPLRALYKQGNTKREEERAPHLAAAAAVQAKWKPALDDAEQWGKRLVDAIDAFRKAEKKKLEDAERERQRIERERIAEETRKRLEAEAASAARPPRRCRWSPSPKHRPTRSPPRPSRKPPSRWRNRPQRADQSRRRGSEPHTAAGLRSRRSRPRLSPTKSHLRRT